MARKYSILERIFGAKTSPEELELKKMTICQECQIMKNLVALTKKQDKKAKNDQYMPYTDASQNPYIPQNPYM